MSSRIELEITRLAKQLEWSPERFKTCLIALFDKETIFSLTQLEKERLLSFLTTRFLRKNEDLNSYLTTTKRFLPSDFFL